MTALYIGWLTLVLLVFIGALLLHRHRRTDRAIDGVRDRIEGLDQATGLEHEKMAETLKRVDGRSQFLVATTIAEELAAAKAAKAKEGGGHDDDVH